MQPYEVFYLSEGKVITADSIPDLDDWGVDEWWGCSDWVAWHKANKRKYGKEIANQKFAEHWKKQTMGAGALDCRTFNTSFRKYVERNNLFDTVYESAGLLGLVLKPVGGASDFITEGSKTLKYLVYVAVGGGLIYGGVKLYQALKKK